MIQANAGTLIANRYRLLRKLGEGGMGSVWQAEDRALRIEVALKLVDATESIDILARFEREAHAAARLRSTHIVHINDYGIDQVSATPYIAMDLLEGESLASLLAREKRLSFEHTRRLLLQVAQALRLAHQKKIVHRDLKPDNIFIAREGDLELVKVLDFGIAKRLDARSIRSVLETQVGQVLGTPFYMSPEQAQGRSDVDHRADIWAFGVIAYECITGQRPVDEHNLAALMAKICNASMPVPSRLASVPAGFDSWFARTVASNRDERFASIDEAAALLAAMGPQLVRHPRIAPRVPENGDEVASPPVVTKSDAALVMSSVAPAAARRLLRRQANWFIPGVLLLALVVVGGVYSIFGRTSASVAAPPTQSDVASAAPPPTQNEIASATVQTMPPPIAGSAPAETSMAAPSQEVTAMPPPVADSSPSALPRPLTAKRKPAAAARGAPRATEPAIEPTPQPHDDPLAVPPPDKYDPGI